MKITIKGCEPLLLTSDLIQPETGKFDATTSYASKLVTRLKQKAYRQKKLPLKLACLKVLKDRMNVLGYPKTYYEPLAGVGLSVKLFNPKGQLWLNDMDPGCQQVLKANFPKAKVWGGDMFGQGFPDADLIFLDFNDYTFKRFLTTNYAEILERAFEHAKKYVILNDCSNFYFRYGESSFKVYSKLVRKDITSVEEYLETVRLYYGRIQRSKVGWDMVHAAYFRESSFQLFYRGNAPFCVDEIKEGLPVAVSEGLLS